MKPKRYADLQIYVVHRKPDHFHSPTPIPVISKNERTALFPDKPSFPHSVFRYQSFEKDYCQKHRSLLDWLTRVRYKNAIFGKSTHFMIQLTLAYSPLSHR